MTISQTYALQALEAALEAGQAIMQVYRAGFAVDHKTDGSPITEADCRSNQILLNALEATGLPIISEETPIAPMAQRQQWEYFWLVDPLDGTKEFVNRNGEFTINVALICKGQPVMGILTAPALDYGYMGIAGLGAWKIPSLKSLEDHWINDLAELCSTLPILKPSLPSSTPTLAVSRSHKEKANEQIIKQILGEGSPYVSISRGSALKFGLLAEGKAHYYMRYDKIWEWDTAAGHAILMAAGGSLLCWPSGQELIYNKESLRNPAFVACSSKIALGQVRHNFPLQKRIGEN